MATKIVRDFKFPGSSDTYQVNALASYVPRITQSVLTLAYEQALDSQRVYFCGSDGTSLDCPANYCIVTIMKGNNHRTLLDAYCLTTNMHYTNGNQTASPDESVRGTWTGWTTWARDAFKTVKVAGTNLVADGGEDVLTITAGTGIKLTPNSSGDSFEIATNLTSPMQFLGTSTTAISDGSTTSTITVNSKSVTVTTGNVVLYGGYEYVWTGSAWEQLGQEGSFSLKTHTHTVSHTPGGSVGNADITPAGTVSQPTFTGTEESHTHSFSGTASHNHDFTGTGVMIKGSFTGTEQTASVSYTPAGSVSTPTITVTPNTTTVNSITAVGTLPSLTKTDIKVDDITNWSAGSGSFTATISSTSATTPNKVVTLSHGHTAPSLSYTEKTVTQITDWSAGTLPTKGSNTTVVTGIKSATSTQPTFSGTAATISHKHTPSGTVTITTAAPVSGETATYTPAGKVGSKSITISGTSGSTAITPKGTVSKPTFTGTAATHNHSFTGTAATLTTTAANS